MQDSEKAKRMAGGVRKSQVSWSPFSSLRCRLPHLFVLFVPYLTLLTSPPRSLPQPLGLPSLTHPSHCQVFVFPVFLHLSLSPSLSFGLSLSLDCFLAIWLT